MGCVVESQSLSFLEVTIPFEESHLFFPRIITVILLVLLAAILVSRRNRMLPCLRHAGQVLASSGSGFDRMRFFGTLILTAAYFYLMSVVGDLFPNTGYGFMIVSIPYIFLLSVLYVDNRSRRNLVIIGLNAVIAPALAWYIFAQLFRITLP